MIFVAVLVLVSATVARVETAIPERIEDARFKGPAWAAADVAVFDGVLREDVLGEWVPKLRDAARKNTAWAQSKTAADGRPASGDDCHVSIGVASGSFKTADSLWNLSSSAEAIVSGRIIEVREGFMYGWPGSLFSLKADILKGKAAGPVLLFYPSARIQTREGMICANPLGKVTTPQVGDRLIAFSMETPAEVGGYTILRVSETRELVHESKTGMQVPQALKLLVTDGDSSAFDRLHRAVVLAVR